MGQPWWIVTVVYQDIYLFTWFRKQQTNLFYKCRKLMHSTNLFNSSKYSGTRNKNFREKCEIFSQNQKCEIPPPTNFFFAEIIAFFFLVLNAKFLRNDFPISVETLSETRNESRKNHNWLNKFPTFVSKVSFFVGNPVSKF